MRNSIIVSLLGILSLSCPLSAEIIEQSRTVELNYNYFAGAGNVTLDGEDEIEGSDGTHLDFNFELSEENAQSAFAGNLEGTLIAEGNFIQQDEDGTVVYTELTGKQSTTVTMSGSGSHLNNGNFGVGSFNSVNPGNVFIFPFTVTEEAEVGTLKLSMQRKLETDNLIQCFIQVKDGEVWRNHKTYNVTARTVFYSESITFEPGEWRIRCTMPAAGTFSEGGDTPDAIDLRQELEFTLRFGTPLTDGSYPLPQEGDFTHNEVYTEHTDSPNLAFVSPEILAEISQGDGTTEVEYTTNLVNASLCPWSSVFVRVRTGQPGSATVENLFPQLHFPNIPATSTVPSAGSGKILVADVELATVKAGILDGSLLTTEGKEQIVFRYPIDHIIRENHVETQRPSDLPYPMDFPYQIENSIDPTFYVETPSELDPDTRPFLPGELIIEWEPVYTVPPRRIQPPAFSEPIWIRNFDSKFPMWITGASLDMGSIPNPRFTSRISGIGLSYFDLIKHGRLQHVISNPLEGYASSATERNQIDTQAQFPIFLPIHFDRIKLDDIVTLSGNFNFAPGPFVIDYDFAGGTLKEFLVTVEYTAEANFLLETANHEEVGGSPLVDEEKTLFEAPLCQVTLPGGIQFTPTLSLEAGAVVEATRSLSIPFTSRYTVKVTSGIKDGLPFYDDQSTFEPLKVSDPSIYEAIGASASVFLNAELAAVFSYPSALTSGGPTIGAQIKGDFNLAPLDNPWWSTTSEVELTAGLEMDFGEYFKIVDAEKPLQTFQLHDADAGGPLVGGGGFLQAGATSGQDAGGANPGFRTLTNSNERWARTLESADATAPESVFLIPLIGSTDVLTGQASALSNRIHRVASNGAVVESMKADLPFKVADASPADDGGAFILGKRTSVLEIAQLDSELNLVGGVEFTMPGTYTPLRLRSTSDKLYVLGKVFGGSPGRIKSVLTCLSHDGSLDWSKTYDLVDNAIVNPGNFLICSDGNLVFCGDTSANFEEANGLDPSYVLVNGTHNGFVSKIDAATGLPIWTTLVAHLNTPTYKAIAESPTGEISIGGRNAIGVLNKEPSMMLVQLSAEGRMLETLLIGHAGSTNARVNPNADALFLELPQDGETWFDEIRDLVWTEEGLWACGEMGIYNGGQPSRFNGSTGFSLFFDHKLKPSRFAIHGGNARDTFDRLLITGDGPLLTGISRSFHPWPNGSKGEADTGSPVAQWLVKLPWEGRLGFHQLSNAAQINDEPLGGSYYVYPRVVSGLLSGGFDINQPEYDTYGRGDDRIPDATSSLLAEDNAPIASTFTMTFSPADVGEVKALEYQPKSLITNQETYFDWYQLDANDDSDADEMSAELEFFFGTNPTQSEPLPLSHQVIEGDPMMIEFTLTRSKLAAGVSPSVLSSVDLLNRIPRTDVTVSVEPFDSERDLIRLTLPAPEDRQFYEIALPED